MKKVLGPQVGSKIRVFAIFKVAPLVFLNITQGCSLGQFLTSSRAETSPNCGRNDLFYSIVVKRSLNLLALFHVESVFAGTPNNCATSLLVLPFSSSDFIYLPFSGFIFKF